MPLTYSITAGIGAGFVAYGAEGGPGQDGVGAPLMWLIAFLFPLLRDRPDQDPARGLRHVPGTTFLAHVLSYLEY